MKAVLCPREQVVNILLWLSKWTKTSCFYTRCTGIKGGRRLWLMSASKRIGMRRRFVIYLGWMMGVQEAKDVSMRGMGLCLINLVSGILSMYWTFKRNCVFHSFPFYFLYSYIPLQSFCFHNNKFQHVCMDDWPFWKFITKRAVDPSACLYGKVCFLLSDRTGSRLWRGLFVHVSKKRWIWSDSKWIKGMIWLGTKIICKLLFPN